MGVVSREKEREREKKREREKERERESERGCFEGERRACRSRC